jgi:hypothetical protein
MLLASWMGLNSYAFGSWLAEKNEKIDDPREKGTMLDFALLIVFLVVTIAIVIAIRPLVAKYYYSSQDTTKTIEDSDEAVEDTNPDKTDCVDDDDKDESISSIWAAPSRLLLLARNKKSYYYY